MYIIVGLALLISIMFIGVKPRKSTPELNVDYINKSNYYKSSWQRLGRWKIIIKSNKKTTNDN